MDENKSQPIDQDKEIEWISQNIKHTYYIKQWVNKNEPIPRTYFSIPQNVSEFYAIKISYGVTYLVHIRVGREREKRPIKDALVFFQTNI